MTDVPETRTQVYPHRQAHADAHADTMLHSVHSAGTESPGPESVPLSRARPSILRTTVLPRRGAGHAADPFDRDRYEHAEPLGAGGMGEVIKAQDNDIGRPVAVKRLFAGTVADPEVVARFAEEVRTVGQLEHPNIVPIHDVGMDPEGRYYFVMKYVQGETLEHVISRLKAGDLEYHVRFTFAHRVKVFVAILEAIQYAHARGIVHRDLKPANVMVGPFGEVVVMDWGIAKRMRDESGEPRAPRPPADAAAAASPGQTLAGDVLGTPAYMSPEQAVGEPVDERSDIYSLCVLLHELLGLEHYLADCGSVTAMLTAVISRPVPWLGKSNEYQPPPPADLCHFVRKGLEKFPGDRFQSIGEMLERLRARADGDIPIECPVTFVRSGVNTAGRFVDRHPRIVVALTAIVPILTVLAVVFAIVRLMR